MKGLIGNRLLPSSFWGLITHMNNLNRNQYAPDSVSAPGETLEEILEMRGMSQAELADRTGRPRKTINEIIRGKAAITAETALQLEKVLGIPQHFGLPENRIIESCWRVSKNWKGSLVSPIG